MQQFEKLRSYGTMQSVTSQKHENTGGGGGGGRKGLTCLLLQCLLELVDAWWDFQTLVQHLLLALQANVVWPPHEASHVTFGLDAAT